MILTLVTAVNVRLSIYCN